MNPVVVVVAVVGGLVGAKLTECVENKHVVAIETGYNVKNSLLSVFPLQF